MSNFIDYKATVWGRLEFDDSIDKDLIIKKLEEGFLPAELCDIEELKFKHFHFMDDTEEFITPIENDGESTIELIINDETVWDNSFESEIERKRNPPYKAAIWWSVEDFAGMAEQLFEIMTYYDENSPESVKERAKRILSTCKDWRDYFDESKFAEALDRMIHKHDAEYGITWESIKYYLNEMCVKEEQEEND